MPLPASAFALTYGRGDWVRNVLHAGGCDLLSRRRIRRLTNPRVVADAELRLMPALARPILRLVKVDEVLLADVDAGNDTAART